MARVLIVGGSDAGISAGLNIGELDLRYTPPLSSPWDPLQMAAQHWRRNARTVATGNEGD